MPDSEKVKRNRADKLELDRRLFTIQGWILEGVTYMVIIQQILMKEWCTSERHAKRLVKKAHEEWKYEESEELEKKRKKRVHQLEHLSRSVNSKHKGTPAAINAQRSIFKLIKEIEGTGAPKNIQELHTNIAIDNSNAHISHMIPQINIMNPHTTNDNSNQAAV